jgi:hypothetical protein
LHPDQRLLNAEWQSPASRALLEAVQKLQDVEKTFLEVIPTQIGYNLGKVDEWPDDRSNNYLNIFKDALKKIEDGLPKVPPPTWESDVKAVSGYDGHPLVKYHGSVGFTIHSPAEGIRVRVNKNEDPRNAKQFVTVEPGMSWAIEVQDSCTYWMVAQNGQGEFSNVLQVVFTNLDEGFRLIRDTVVKLDPADREYRFRNPVDKHSLAVLLKDIIEQIKTDHRISPDDIRSAFSEALQELLPKD